MSDVLEAVGQETEGESPFICEWGFVHEVDPATLAVKAVIPAIDPHGPHDSWVVQLTPWMGKPGYGPVYAPAVGSEIVIFGKYGERHSLFYVSRANEASRHTGDFADGARGEKHETAYRLLSDLFIEMTAQDRIRLAGVNLAELVGAVIRLSCGGGDVLTGEAGKIAFLGAAPTGKKTLPPAATDLASCIALANALRAHEIERGLCQ